MLFIIGERDYMHWYSMRSSTKHLVSLSILQEIVLIPMKGMLILIIRVIYSDRDLIIYPSNFLQYTTIHIVHERLL